MRAFVSMRKYIIANANVLQRIESLELKQVATEQKMDEILDRLDDGTTTPIYGIVFEGKVFDARLGVSNIIKLVETHEKNPKSHEDIRRILSVNRQVLMSDLL